MRRSFIPTKPGSGMPSNEKYFWQERLLGAGFREYPKDIPHRDWFFDIDAGPIIDGYSPAGNAYAVAACKVNGRFDHAYMITAQVLAACWPLPDGSLLGTRFLSSDEHAPYLGEANMLFLLTRTPVPGVEIRTGGHLPGLVYLTFLFYFGIGAGLIFSAIRGLWRWRRDRARISVPAERLQFGLWVDPAGRGVRVSSGGQSTPRGFHDPACADPA